MPDGVATRTVADVMSSPPVTASSSDTLAAATERMQQHHVGSVVVVDDQRPIGILTERDLVRFGAAGGDASTAKVSEWMTPEPDCIAPDVEVTTAWTSLAEHGYRHIPVVERGQLVGVVSMRDLMRIAQIRPVEGEFIDVPKGLAGVVVAETTVGDVRGLEGFYHYRHYNAVELAEKRPLEDVWRLLFDGALPRTDAERAAFLDEIRPLRSIPDEIRPLVPALANPGGHFVPMDAVRTAVSAMAISGGFRFSTEISAAELRTNAMHVCAVIPTLIMALYRLHHGQEPIDPHPDLGYGGNYLYMLTGDVPDRDLARAVEQYQISTIDHGFNASTFTSRVITSTGADLVAAVVGGIGALSGPLHGGAPSKALALLDEIGTVDRAREVIVAKVEAGDKIMGFGHRVYKTDDPRSVLLRSVAERIGAAKIDFAKKVEQTVVDVLTELKPGRNLYANVEFYAGVVMDHCGLPQELFTPTFASSRVIGWCANVLEQAADNRIIRPSARYVGPPPPEPVPDLH